jgi:hypothetical protein
MNAEDDDDDDDAYRMTAEEMEALCERIESNDPSLTIITDFDNNDFQRMAWYSRRLGEALLSNNFVVDLYLDLTEILEAEEFRRNGDIDENSPLLQYLGTSRSLRKVAFTKSDHTYSEHVTMRIADGIFRAVASNPSVLDFSFGSEDVSPETWAHLLRTTTSIRTLIAIVDKYVDPSSWETIATAFGANQTLEDLWLIAYIAETGIAERVLAQLGSHPRLRRLELQMNFDATSAQFEAISAFVVATTSLQEIKLSRYRFKKQHMTLIISALNSNPRVTTLNLHMHEHMKQIKLLLRHLPSLIHVRTLDVFTIWDGRSSWSGLQAAIRANGSLHAVKGCCRSLSECEKDFMLACGKRNEQVPTLLSQPDLDHCSDKDDQDGKTAMPMFPPLFQSSFHSPGMSPKSFLVGLMALEGPVIGSVLTQQQDLSNLGADRKRARAHTD